MCFSIHVGLRLKGKRSRTTYWLKSTDLNMTKQYNQNNPVENLRVEPDSLQLLSYAFGLLCIMQSLTGKTQGDIEASRQVGNRLSTAVLVIFKF